MRKKKIDVQNMIMKQRSKFNLSQRVGFIRKLRRGFFLALTRPKRNNIWEWSRLNDC